MNRKYNDNQIFELHSKGLTDKEIAEIVGCTPNQMAVKRRKLGLHPNKPNEALELSREELEVLTGTLLGDSCIRFVHSGCKYPSFTCTHTERQEEWFMWKVNKLKSIISSYNSYELKSNGKMLDHCKLQAIGKNLKCLTSIRNVFYPNGTKVIPMEFIKDNFSGLSLYCLYMDDGSYDTSTNSFIINTQCFSKENLLEFITWIKDSFNLEFSVKADSSLYLKHTSNKLFQTILLKYNECDSMSYKLGLSSRRKTPLNRESPIKDNPVLNPQEIGENAKRLTVMPNEKDEAIKSDTKAGHYSEMS